jgi:hypothetical protein
VPSALSNTHYSFALCRHTISCVLGVPFATRLCVQGFV